MTKIFWCKNCLNMSTRPRITFDDRGGVMPVYGCKKKSLDWSKKKKN